MTDQPTTRQRTNNALQALAKVTTPDELLSVENRMAELITECTDDEAAEIGEACLQAMKRLGLFKKMDS